MMFTAIDFRLAMTEQIGCCLNPNFSPQPSGRAHDVISALPAWCLFVGFFDRFVSHLDH